MVGRRAYQDMLAVLAPASGNGKILGRHVAPVDGARDSDGGLPKCNGPQKTIDALLPALPYCEDPAGSSGGYENLRSPWPERRQAAESSHRN
jgi:hypothetical protein